MSFYFEVGAEIPRVLFGVLKKVIKKVLSPESTQKVLKKVVKKVLSPESTQRSAQKSTQKSTQKSALA